MREQNGWFWFRRTRAVEEAATFGPPPDEEPGAGLCRGCDRPLVQPGALYCGACLRAQRRDEMKLDRIARGKARKVGRR